MDDTKCRALKAELEAQPTPQIVSVERFFDGNAGMLQQIATYRAKVIVDAFRDLLTGLLHRPDVQAVYAQISELDPGDGCWPFTDTIFVVGTISPEELCSILSSLEPDEVGSGEHFGIPAVISQKHQAPVLAAWWD